MAVSYTEQNSNFARLSRLIVDICAEVLREILKRRQPNLQAFQSVLQSRRSTLRNELSTYQRNILYPTSTSVYQGNFKDLDISLLYTLLRTTGNISPHTNGWGCIPQDSDDTLSANIERIRLAKNDCYSHLVGTAICDAKFNEIWDTLHKAVESVENGLFHDHRFTTQIKELHEDYLDVEEARQSIKDLQKQYNEDHQILKHVQDDVATLFQRVDERTRLKGPTGRNGLLPKDKHHVFTRAAQEGINKMKAFGITIFTGREGSGKSTHGRELLRDIRNGTVFGRNFNIIESRSIIWEELAHTTDNTAIFLDDPLGEININETFVNYDGGLFNKIWSCVRTENVKIIMAIRSNILQKNKAQLEKHDIFNECHVVDLSSGKFELNQKEKQQIAQQFCKLNHISIVKEIMEENIDSKTILNSDFTAKISEITIKEISEANPLLGFPLCCKLFFSNRSYLRIGLRFFSQPSGQLKDEIRNLATGNEMKRRQFLLLFYTMLQHGALNMKSINANLLKILAKRLQIRDIGTVFLRRSLKEITGTFIVNVDDEENKFIFLHLTVLQAVCLTACEDLDNLPIVVERCDKRILAELIKTAAYERVENEEILKLDIKYNSILAKRFIQEIKENRCGQILSHQAFDDFDFLSKFTSELGKRENLDITSCRGRQGYSLFNLSCLYNKAKIVECMLKTHRVPKEIFADGFGIAVEFQKVETISIMLKYAERNQILIKFFDLCYYELTKPETIQVFLKEGSLKMNDVGKGFIFASRKNSMQNLRTIMTFAPNLPSSFIAKGIHVACKHNNITAVRLFLSKRRDLAEEHIIRGFIAACRSGNTESIKYILRCKRNLTMSTLIRGLSQSCRYGKTESVKVIMEERNDIPMKDIEDLLVGLCFNSDKFIQDNSTCILEIVKTFHHSRPRLSTECWNNVLQCSSAKGHLSILQYIFDQGVVQFSSKQIQIAFLLASSNGNYESVELLGRKLNFVGHSDQEIVNRGFVNACLSSDSRTVDMILGVITYLPSENIVNALKWACLRGNRNMVKVIVQAKPDLHHNYIAESLIKAREYGNHHLVDLIVCLRPDVHISIVEHAFVKACSTNNKDTVKTLIEARSDLLAEHISLGLTNASASGFPELVEYIMTERQNEFSVIQVIEALYKACKFDRVHAVRILLNRDEEIPLEDIEMALRKVRYHRFYECENEIVKKRPEVDFHKYRLHAFVQACVRGYTETVELLLQNIPDENISLGLLSASVSGQDAVVDLIIQNRKNCIDEYQLSVCFVKACRYGNKTTVNSFMQNHVLDKSTILRGVEEAHNHGRNDIVDLIFEKRQDLPPKLLQKAFSKACALSQYNSLKNILNFRKDLPYNVVVQEFIEACSCGNEEVVKIILSHRADLLKDDLSQGLVAACAKGFKKIVEKILFNNNMEVLYSRNISDLSSLQVEQVNCNFSCFHIQQALTAARDNGFHNIEDMIRESRLDLSLETVSFSFIKFCTSGKDENVGKILRCRSDLSLETVTTGLLNACAAGFEKIVDVISKYRDDLTSSQVNMCLFKACRLGHHTVVASLLRRFPKISLEHVTKTYITSCEHSTPEVISEILVHIHKLDLDNVREGLMRAYLSKRHSNINVILRSRLEVMKLEPLLSLENSYENGYYSTAVKILKSGFLSLEQISHSFVKACSFDYPDIIDVFLQTTPEISKEDIAAGLLDACSCGHSDIVSKILLQRKDLQIEHIRQGIEKAYRCGYTDLMNQIMNLRQDL